MADLILRLRVDPVTGRREIVIDYTSDSDALPMEHEEEHRRLADKVVDGGLTQRRGHGQPRRRRSAAPEDARGSSRARPREADRDQARISMALAFRDSEALAGRRARSGCVPRDVLAPAARRSRAAPTARSCSRRTKHVPKPRSRSCAPPASRSTRRCPRARARCGAGPKRSRRCGSRRASAVARACS